MCRGTDDFEQTDESKSKHKPPMEELTPAPGLKTRWLTVLALGDAFCFHMLSIVCLFVSLCVFLLSERETLFTTSLIKTISPHFPYSHRVLACAFEYLCQTITVNGA